MCHGMRLDVPSKRKLIWFLEEFCFQTCAVNIPAYYFDSKRRSPIDQPRRLTRRVSNDNRPRIRVDRLAIKQHLPTSHLDSFVCEIEFHLDHRVATCGDNIGDTCRTRELLIDGDAAC